MADGTFPLTGEAALESLTERQLQLALLVLDRKTDPQIADELLLNSNWSRRFGATRLGVRAKRASSASDAACSRAERVARVAPS